ncbi:MAG TPA: hypothetical protein VM367_02915 [Pseudonocardia sp.]|jgi:hypothetical protein|nr:hypothetical protein [Pseudonocardia sp.]
MSPVVGQDPVPRPYERTDLVVASPHDVATGDLEGAGFVSSWADLDDAVRHGDGGEIASAAVGAGLDSLGAVMSPLDALVGAGVGWLVEHVSFLHEPLDRLAGDPVQIRDQARTWHNVSEALRALADDYGADVAGLAAWDGLAADAYRGAAAHYEAGLREGAATALGLSDRILAAGAHVGLVRSIVRDLIVDLVVELVYWAAGTLAASLVTVGGSVAAFIGWAVMRAATTAADVASRIATLLDDLAAAADALTGTVGRISTVATSLARRTDGAVDLLDDVARRGHAVQIAGQGVRDAGLSMLPAAAVPGPSTPLTRQDVVDTAAAVTTESWKQKESAEAAPRDWEGGGHRPRDWERMVRGEQ